MTRLSAGSAAASSSNALQKSIDAFLRGESFTFQVPSSFARKNPEFIQNIKNQRKELDRQRAAQLSSGVTPGTTQETLPRTFEEALAQANKLNEERFQQGLEMFKQMQQNVDKFGQTRQEQLRRDLTQANAADASNLVSRGLFNSTALENLQRARQQDVGFQQTALEEAIARSRNEVLGQQVGFIERRTDAGPDPALFANLQTAASSAPRGSAISGGGGGGSGGSSSNMFQKASGQPADRDFAGREIVPFGQLKFTGPRTTTTRNVNATSGNVNERQRARRELERIIAPVGHLSDSQLQSMFAKVGATINKADDLRRLTPQQVMALGRLITGQG